MSFRDDGKDLAAWVKDVERRLQRMEGGGLRGPGSSFGLPFQVGDFRFFENAGELCVENLITFEVQCIGGGETSPTIFQGLVVADVPFDPVADLGVYQAALYQDVAHVAPLNAGAFVNGDVLVHSRTSSPFGGPFVGVEPRLGRIQFDGTYRIGSAANAVSGSPIDVLAPQFAYYPGPTLFTFDYQSTGSSGTSDGVELRYAGQGPARWWDASTGQWWHGVVYVAQDLTETAPPDRKWFRCEFPATAPAILGVNDMVFFTIEAWVLETDPATATGGPVGGGTSSGLAAPPASALDGGLTLTNDFQFEPDPASEGWDIADGAGGLSNGELSAPKPSNVAMVSEVGTIGGRFMRLTMQPEVYDGLQFTGVQMENTSVLLGGGGPFYVEVRCRWTGYLGGWYGPWMYDTGSAAEIDVMETVNTEPPWTTTHNPNIATAAYAAVNDGAWHRYGLRIDSGGIKRYFDNVLVSTVVNPTAGAAFVAASMFPKVQHLFGGTFPDSDHGSAITNGDGPATPQFFDIDYYRIYR